MLDSRVFQYADCVCEGIPRSLRGQRCSRNQRVLDYGYRSGLLTPKGIFYMLDVFQFNKALSDVRQEVSMAEKNEKRNVRVELNAEQHKTLRLAAALSDQAMAEFAREAVLASAMKVTSDVKLPATAVRPASRRTAT